MEIFNAAVYLMLGGIIAWAVLSKHVKDGIVFKAGLILIALSCGAAAAVLIDSTTWGEAVVVTRISFMRSVGLVLIVVGLLLGRRHGRVL